VTPNEYNKVVDLHADNIYRFVLKSLKNTEKARDIVQESFERLWVNRNKVGLDKSKSYLFTIAYRLIIDEVRILKWQTEILSDYGQDTQTNNTYNDLNEILHRAIERLPHNQRSVILLRDYEGYSYDEIGRITGLNKSQVKVYIYRARLFLKQYIGTLDKVI
jgi:RNA polymerase sigma-70 factor (ECF subfamily)